MKHLVIGAPWRIVAVLALIGGMLAAAAPPPLEAGPRVGVSIGVGPFWWGPPYWPYYPPPRYYYPYPYWDPYWYPYWPPPVVYDPPVYIQRRPDVPAPPDGPYWYYCASSGGYYPTVKQCPEAWIKVPPRPE